MNLHAPNSTGPGLELTALCMSSQNVCVFFPLVFQYPVLETNHVDYLIIFFFSLLSLVNITIRCIHAYANMTRVEKTTTLNSIKNPTIPLKITETNTYIQNTSSHGVCVVIVVVHYGRKTK